MRPVVARRGPPPRPLATSRGSGGARAMGTFDWSPEYGARLAAIRDDLAQVSTATAFTLLHQHGWRNTYMKGLHPLQELGLGQRLVGRARTCRYLLRRGPERPPATEEDVAAS